MIELDPHSLAHRAAQFSADFDELSFLTGGSVQARGANLYT
jgi:hypothetical protein